MRAGPGCGRYRHGPVCRGINDNAKFELAGADLQYIGPVIDYENASAQKQFTVMLQAKDAGGVLSPIWPVVVSVSDVVGRPLRPRTSF